MTTTWLKLIKRVSEVSIFGRLDMMKACKSYVIYCNKLFTACCSYAAEYKPVCVFSCLFSFSFWSLRSKEIVVVELIARGENEQVLTATTQLANKSSHQDNGMN